MADKKISALDAYTPPIATDVLPIVDVTLGATKKITVANLQAYILAQTPNITLNGQAARTISSTRNITADTAGNSLTQSAGSATIGATDKAGGDHILAAGISTGTGLGSTRIKRNGRAASTGTTDNAQYDAIIAIPPVFLADATATAIFKALVASNTTCGGMFCYTVEATDGTDFQSHSGVIVWSAVNKAGAITATIGQSLAAGGNIVESVSAGTLADVWTIVTDTGKVIIKANFDSSLTPTLIKVFGTIFNNSNQGITVL